ncbi:sensor histidine kinase [Actinoplanes sp. NPDC051861]|uniref:sensor histidine kinase n=1 Tax=Actinoplanes sp. NPDC051861 TaxID=3155170 RepID=UPI003441D12A
MQDLLLALLITVMQVQGTVAKTAAESGPDPGTLGYALLIVSGLALVVRRRWPVAVFAVTACCSLIYYALDLPDGPGWLALFVAIYTLTAQGDGRRSLWIAGGGITILTIAWLVSAIGIEPRAAIGWVFFRIGASVMSAALGESVRSRRVIAADAVARAEQETRARVDEERLRIAREVHDTVAHAIAIINVQSGVTAHVLDKRPEQAREALEVIEQTSSRALREMRAVLGVLQDGDDGRAPLPGLGQIGELTAKARAAGLDVDYRAGEPPTMPGAVGLAVYRILQESITNVIRHAGPTRVTIDVECGDEAVRVRVADEGPRAGRPAGEARTDPGRGLTGMRERCRLLGGDFEAGPVKGGGFAVTASIPTGETT